MPRPERVLIDTSAFYALISSTDTFHNRARQVYEGLIDREQELWTTSYVFVETTALVHHRLGFEPLRVFVESIRNLVQTLWVDSALHEHSWRELVQNQGRGLSFVDWTTAVAARRLKAHVFTFDRDFVAQGIAVIPQ